MNPSTTRSNIPPILFIVAAAVLFSTGGLFIKLTPLSAFTISCGRSLVAAVTVAALTRRAGFRLNGLVILASVLYATLLLTFVIANKWTTAANAIFLQFTAPVYILILEPIFYKERFRPRDLFVVLVCMAGMSLFFVGEEASRDLPGNMIALASGVCFALFMLLLRHEKAGATNRASSVIYGNLLLGVVTLPFFVAEVRSIQVNDLLIISYLGVVQIGIAYMFFTQGFARGVRSLDAGIVGYIEPVLNPLWVFIFIDERPSRWALTGGAIIIGAVLLHTLWGARRARVERCDAQETGARNLTGM